MIFRAMRCLITYSERATARLEGVYLLATVRQRTTSSISSFYSTILEARTSSTRGLRKDTHQY